MTQAFNLSQLGNNINSSGQVSLTAGITGTLPIANGGTNLTSAGTSGYVMTSNGSAFVMSASSGGLGGQTVFTSGGTFTIPAGKTVVKVIVIGAGGGSGGIFGYCCQPISANGASSGGAAVKYLTGLTPGNTLTVSCGTGGTAGVGSVTPTSGGTGGSSSVASGTQSITTVSATGGAGSAGRYNSTTYGGAFNAPGTGSGGDYNVNGNVPTYTNPNTISVQASARGGIAPILGGNASIDATISTGGAVIGGAGSYGAGGSGSSSGGNNSAYNGAIGGGGIVIFQY
jgi:hypothetical protein